MHRDLKPENILLCGNSPKKAGKSGQESPEAAAIIYLHIYIYSLCSCMFAMRCLAKMALCYRNKKSGGSMFEAFWLQSVIHGRLTTSNAFMKGGPSPCGSRHIPSSFASFSFYLSCLHFFQYDTHYVSLCEIILYSS